MEKELGYLGNWDSSVYRWDEWDRLGLPEDYVSARVLEEQFDFLLQEFKYYTSIQIREILRQLREKDDLNICLEIKDEIVEDKSKSRDIDKRSIDNQIQLASDNLSQKSESEDVLALKQLLGQTISRFENTIKTQTDFWDKLSHLESILKQAENGSDSTARELAAAKSENQFLEHENFRISTDLEKKSRENNDLKAELKASLEGRARMLLQASEDKQRLLDSISQHNTGTTLNGEALQEIERLESQLQLSIQKVEDSQSRLLVELKEVEQKHEKIKGDHEELKKERESFQKEKEELQKKYEKIQEIEKLLGKSLQDFQEQYNQLDKERDRYIVELAHLNTAYTALNAELDYAKNAMIQLESTNAESQQKNLDLTQELAKYSDEKSSLQTELQQVLGEKHKVESRLPELVHLLQEANHQKELLQGDLQPLLQALFRDLSSINQQEADPNNWASLTQLQNQLSQIQGYLRQIVPVGVPLLEGLRQENATLREQSHKLEQEGDRLQNELNHSVLEARRFQLDADHCSQEAKTLPRISHKAVKNGVDKLRECNYHKASSSLIS